MADPRSVEAAEQRDLIAAAANGDAVFVGHPLYGEIRLSQCGPLRLQRLRGRVASVMAKLDDVDPLRLGLLWLESDLPPEIEILSRAAYISGSRLDLGLAERLARAAAEAHPNPLTKLQLAYILFLQENGEEAEAVLDTLDPREMAIPGFVDGVILRAGNLLWPLRNPDESHSVIEAALRLGDDARIPSLRTFRAVQHVMAAQPVKTVTTMAEVDYESLDNFGRLLGYSAETIALGDLGHLDRAAQMVSEGYRVLDESPLDSFHGTGLAEFHAYALLAAGNVAEAHAVSEHQHLQYAELPGLSRSMAVAALGMTALAMGDLAAALRYLSSAAASFGDYGNISGLFYRFRILLTEALARSGQIEAAVASLEATRQGRHPAYQYVESGYLLASAWVVANQGRTSEAREITLRAAEFARQHEQAAREVLCLQMAVQFGDATGADRLTELATQVQGPRAPVAARYARALANDDTATLDAVSGEFDAMGDRLAAADAAAQAATSHRRGGRRGSALTSSARARLLAKDCGGAVSPALAAARVPLPFTRREHEIAKLLSHGLSNRDIAEAMSLSVRTVDWHIYQASAKAGVSSRSELATLVQRFTELEVGSERG
jgi:DNA-binding NarL/FixJ family response regulator